MPDRSVEPTAKRSFPFQRLGSSRVRADAAAIIASRVCPAPSTAARPDPTWGRTYWGGAAVLSDGGTSRFTNERQHERTSGGPCALQFDAPESTIEVRRPLENA